MNFKLLLKNEQLLTILHNVLTRENIRIYNTPINIKDFSYNQYSLLITMDIVIKYQIIVNDETYNQSFLNKLDYITTNYKNHQDLVIKGNSLLIDLVSKKLNLTITRNEDKKEILKYIYDKYIVNGYCFHSFPSVFKRKIEEDGITLNVDYKEINDLKKINYIFEHHNYKNFISKNLKEKNRAIYITDSPAMAYFYAFRSPEYMAELTSLSKYYNYLENYNKNAFYEKDYHECKSNLVSLCKHVNMTPKEENTILKTFDKRWHSLNLDNSRPTIAFIKRRDLAKNSLSNIDDIINSVDKNALNILVSKILDSKYPVIRRYTDIEPLDLKIITMPSYREIKDNKFISKEKPKVVLTTRTRVDYQEEKRFNYNYKKAYSYGNGNANVIALLGLLFVTLGLTLSIIINVLGDQL